MTEEQQHATWRGKIAAILALALLLACGFWLVHRLGAVGAIQDCVASGRHDCGQSGSASP